MLTTEGEDLLKSAVNGPFSACHVLEYPHRLLGFGARVW